MGIIDGKPLGVAKHSDRARAQQEADTIFTCIFLGFLQDGLQNGVSLRWDVDPEDVDPQASIAHLRQVMDALVGVLGKDSSIVAIGTSPRYAQDGDDWHLAIAGSAPSSNPGDIDIRQAMTPTSHLVRKRVEEVFRDKDLMAEKIDLEFGAYYGVVDDIRNTNPLLIASVRRLVRYTADSRYGECNRWNRGVPYHGLIGYEQSPEKARKSEKQAGSIEPTQLIPEWDGKDHVCGYCHGMVWALGQARCEFPQDGSQAAGTPYELALGKKTHKLASCFGCSTYLYANGILPSAMHLGRSDSWVPLPEDENGAAPFTFNKEQEAENLRIFQGLNMMWASRVAEWMRQGAIIALNAKLVAPWGKHFAKVLHGKIMALADDQRAIANLFLDALTVHSKDVERLARFVEPAGVAASTPTATSSKGSSREASRRA